MSARLRELSWLSESTREYLVPGPLAEIWIGSGFAPVLVIRPIFIFLETQCHAKLFFTRSLQEGNRCFFMMRLLYVLCMSNVLYYTVDHQSYNKIDSSLHYLFFVSVIFM